MDAQPLRRFSTRRAVSQRLTNRCALAVLPLLLPSALNVNHRLALRDQFFRQMRHLNPARPRAQHKCTLNDVFQFTDITGPVMRQQHRTDIRGTPFNRTIHERIKAPDQVIRQQRNVFAPMTQRWQLDPHDIDTIIKILAECAHPLQ